MTCTRCRSSSAVIGTAAAVFAATILASSASAQTEYDPSIGGNIQCVSCPPSSPSSGGPSEYPGWAEAGQRFGQWMRRQLSGDAQRDDRIARATDLNNQGVTLYNAGSHSAAMDHYRQAFALNDQSPMIRLNMMMTLNWLAHSQIQTARSTGDANALAQAEAMLSESDRLNNDQVASLPAYGDVVAVLGRLRSDVSSARQEQVRARENQRALANASSRISAITGDLSASLSAEGGASRQTASLGFGDPTQLPSAASEAHTDASVVDARGRIGPQYRELPRLEDVENSPGRTAWLRGMDAVANRDWELAAAWFGTAQQRDPTNAAIGRAADLAIFTRDRRRQSAQAPAPSFVAPTDADLELLLPQMQAQARQMWESLTPEERARVQALDAQDAADRAMLSQFPAPQETQQVRAPN